MIALYILLALLLFICLLYCLYLISEVGKEINRLKVYIEYMDSSIDKFAECGKKLMELEKKLTETTYLLNIDEQGLAEIVDMLRARKEEGKTTPEFTPFDGSVCATMEDDLK